MILDLSSQKRTDYIFHFINVMNEDELKTELLTDDIPDSLLDIFLNSKQVDMLKKILCDDAFWKEKLKKMNPDLLILHESLNKKYKYSSFYKKMYELRIYSRNIVFPMRSSEGTYFVMNPALKEKIRILVQEVTADGTGLKKFYTIIPDFFVIRSGDGKSSYKMYSIDRSSIKSYSDYSKIFEGQATMTFDNRSALTKWLDEGSSKKSYLQVRGKLDKKVQKYIDSGFATQISPENSMTLDEFYKLNGLTPVPEKFTASYPASPSYSASYPMSYPASPMSPSYPMSYPMSPLMSYPASPLSPMIPTSPLPPSQTEPGKSRINYPHSHRTQ